MARTEMTLTIWIARHGPLAGLLLGVWLLLVAFTLPYAFDLWNTADLDDSSARTELIAVEYPGGDEGYWWAIDVNGELVPCSGPPGMWKLKMHALYDAADPTRCRYEELVGVPSPLERGLLTACLLGLLALLAGLGFTVFSAWQEAPRLLRAAENQTE